MKGIFIENGRKKKCPTCGTNFAIENNDEILYRNIALLHIKKGEKLGRALCRQCKSMIEFDSL
ncbi:MAG: hypothetical protein ACFFDN_04900 [Candidatus Hodarchaeota archaeon]